MGFNSVFKGLIQIQLHQLYNPTTVQVKVQFTPEQATKAQKGSTGTVHPRTGHEGPEGQYRYSSPQNRPRRPRRAVQVQFTPEQATKAQKGSTGTALNFFFNLGARWGGWSTPRPGHLTHCARGWVGPSAGLDGRKISSPPGFDPGPSSPQSVATPTELPGPSFNPYLC